MTGSAPRVGVLALQGDVREHRAALTAVGAHPVGVRRPDDLAGLDGIVLPGGESTAIGKLAVTAGVLEPLRKAVSAGLPAYGSCAGMILLADAVADGLPDQPLVGGLDVLVRRNAFGRQVDSFEGQIEWAGFAAPVPAVFIRAPWVESTGKQVEVLGRVARHGLHPAGRPGDDAAADQVEQVVGRVVAVRQGSLLATAFHPELTGDVRVHALFVDMVKGQA